jgi:poly(3-hydroxybutyrate) depolymerase
VIGNKQYAGSNQPSRRSFGINDIMVGAHRVSVTTRDVLATPFCTLVEFARMDAHVQRALLVVAPLSGHFPILLRDLVIGLLPWFRVHVTDWTNVRHVGVENGPFGLDTNIACVHRMMQHLSPGLTVVALCQAGVPALAAASVLAGRDNAQAPDNIILIAAPIDPLANPTPVVRLLRSRSLSWMERALIEPVSSEFVGRGRPVYPAALQLSALWRYLIRHVCEGDELLIKLLNDDGMDPRQFPFLDAYTSIMDLDARYFLENTRSLYHDCEMRAGTLRFQGERIEPRVIRHSHVMTIEGERDDIAAPGQTSAAHELCDLVSEGRRLIVPRCGHFSLFHGERWRGEVLPEMLSFLNIDPAPDCSSARG